MNRITVGLVLGLITALAGCSNASSGSAAGRPAARSEKSILGTYENSVDHLSVELKSGGKATLRVDNDAPYETTWERDGEDRIVIYGAEGLRMTYKFNSDGNLSDDMGLGSVLRKK
jgi:hypothetical protein